MRDSPQASGLNRTTDMTNGNVDTLAAPEMAAWLRETAANTRRHREQPYLTDKEMNLAPHVAFRLEQAADLVLKLADALQGLVDEQNGPPLETRREQWQRAYDQARAALTRIPPHE